MNVRTRLMGSFAAIMALLLLPALFAVSRLGELRELAVEGRSRHAAAALTVGRLQAALAELDRYERSYVATGDPHLGASAERALRLMREEVDSLRASPYAQPAKDLPPTLDSMATFVTDIHGLMDQRRVAEATSMFGHLEPLFGSGQGRLRVLGDAIDQIAQEDFRRAGEISDWALRSAMVALALSAFLALAISAATARGITRPLSRLAAATATVAGGTLEDPPDLPYERGDEIGALSLSFRRMTRRLAELDRMKAEFVGVASHELKTPINVINGYAELIEEEMEGELTDHQAQILRGIAEQTRAMSRLVGWLMDISRLEAGTYRMEFDEVHLDDLVTGLMRSFDVLARSKQIELSAHVRDDAPEKIEIDIDVIRDEVLGNLVSNAIRHTPEGGWIRVEVWGEGDEVVFQVSDSGPGIPVEHRAHVFEKYYQVGRARAVGAGLGLAIAREMVDAHGGSVSLVPSEEGHGATFVVRLPVARPA